MFHSGRFVSVTLATWSPGQMPYKAQARRSAASMTSAVENFFPFSGHLVGQGVSFGKVVQLVPDKVEDPGRDNILGALNHRGREPETTN